MNILIIILLVILFLIILIITFQLLNILLNEEISKICFSYIVIKN